MDRNDRTIAERDQSERSEGIGTAPAYEAKTTNTGENTTKKASPDAPATKDEPGVTASSQEKVDDPAGAGEAPQADKAEFAGYMPFRHWLNKHLRDAVVPVKLKHKEEEYLVTEMVVDGRLRLEKDGSPILVPFDETYIEDLVQQIV